jgi:hypothetical protein
MNLLKGFPFSFQKRAGLQRRARPRFLPSRWESRGSLHLDITTYKIFLTNCKKVCQVVLWSFKKGQKSLITTPIKRLTDYKSIEAKKIHVITFKNLCNQTAVSHISLLRS